MTDWVIERVCLLSAVLCVSSAVNLNLFSPRHVNDSRQTAESQTGVYKSIRMNRIIVVILIILIVSASVSPPRVRRELLRYHQKRNRTSAICVGRGQSP